MRLVVKIGRLVPIGMTTLFDEPERLLSGVRNGIADVPGGEPARQLRAPIPDIRVVAIFAR